MLNEIYIGDNLAIMKSKRFKKYKEKFKMIYIDPPYNTQVRKSYNDKLNSDTWIKFMKDRLKVAKTYLKQDGVIFISIDDNEYANLKILCDAIFGSDNFMGTFITKQAQRSNAKHINTIHEYILCFAKDKKKVSKFVINRMDLPEDKKMIERLQSEIKKKLKQEGLESANKELKKLIREYCFNYNITWLKNYSNVDCDGKIFFASDLSTPGVPREVNIKDIDLFLKPLKTRGWSSDKKFIDLYNANRLCFKDGRPYEKKYLTESEDNVPSILNFFSRQGTNDLKKLGITDIFDTPKPVEMLKFLVRISTKSDDYVLDFFAGSGSLAQAVYEVNDEDNRNNKYVLIQLNEIVNKNTSVYKTCLKHKINPDVGSILKFRVDKYLEQNKKDRDYEIYY